MHTSFIKNTLHSGAYRPLNPVCSMHHKSTMPEQIGSVYLSVKNYRSVFHIFYPCFANPAPNPFLFIYSDKLLLYKYNIGIYMRFLNCFFTILLLFLYFHIFSVIYHFSNTFQVCFIIITHEVRPSSPSCSDLRSYSVIYHSFFEHFQSTLFFSILGAFFACFSVIL